MISTLFDRSARWLLFYAAMTLLVFGDATGLSTNTPILIENLDPVTFTQWVDGAEKPLPSGFGGLQPLPQAVLWTSHDGGFAAPVIAYGNSPGVAYGESKTIGIRHLRIGFNNPVPIGSLLVQGCGRPSVLKPDAPYPGDLGDDSQWIPAQRIKDGRLNGEEASEVEQVLWVLPSVISTRAVRFTHVAQPSDIAYHGTLWNACLFSERFANLAPQAVAAASIGSTSIDRIKDEKTDGSSVWSNLPENDLAPSKPLAESQPWVMLKWPQPVTLQKLVALGAGFSAADVQVYAGAADKNPAVASDDDWKTIKSISSLDNLYTWFPLSVIDLGEPVTTRAIRLHLVAPLDEKQMDQRTPGKTRGGNRVWLDELMALQDLKSADLATAILTAPSKETQAHAPIAIDFAIPEDGFVTLVVEDASGKRVRNLIAETPFSKGKNTVYWDGTDDLGRDVEAANHGIYSIPPELVAPGSYTVRGLWHRKIDLRYEMSVYAPGNPPWPTTDGTGGWMTTHTPASSVLFVPGSVAPGGKPEIYLGCYIAEGGSGLSWLDLNGNKLGGRGWVGGTWTGAQFLAYDSGPQALPGIYAYVGSTIRGDTKPDGKETGEIRLTGLTAASGDRPVLPNRYFFDYPSGVDQSANMGGLAVYNGLLVFSQPSLNQLVFVDVKTGQVIGTTPMANPHGLAFDAQGRLLVLTDKSLKRFTLGASPVPLPAGETVTAQLEEPIGITLNQGNIYISDRGTRHQVLVFSPDGQQLKTYGTPGVPKAGIYDPNHMNNPKGITVDSNGRLWVTEEDYQPKRVSVWNRDGTLWKAFYGAQIYGGGGALDTQDGDLFSYMGMEFRLDWKKGDSSLQRVYYRLDDPVFTAADYFAAPEWALHFHGRRYMTNAYNSVPVCGAGIAFLFRDKGDVIVPVAAMGLANGWNILKTDAFKSKWPAGVDLTKDWATFVWSDLNGDGQVQPSEVTMAREYSQGVTIARDGSFLISCVGSDPGKGHAMRYRPVKFTDDGVPIYDLKGQVLADAQNSPSDGGVQILLGSNNWTVQTTAPPPYSAFGLGGTKNGVATWSYPSLWPGLHASHVSPPPDHPGELIGTTRLLGDLVTPKNSDAGPLFLINSNQGNIYVFTQDGLFIAQLFKDAREGSLWEMPSAQPGMLVNDQTLHDEDFFPTVTQIPDGSIQLMTGAIPALVRVEGLESIHRIAPIPIEVSAHDLKLAQDFVARREMARQALQGSGVLTVNLQSRAPTLNAGLQSWTSAHWAPIDQRGVSAYFDANTQPYNVSGAMTVADGKLFALWKTGDPNLLRNSGEIANAPFKTGGALDLMLGTNPMADPQRAQPVEGDLRLLITQVNGATKAVLYRAVVPGTSDKQKVAFSAPWHSITFDSVTDVSNQVQLSVDGKGNYEAAIPLDLLGLNPSAGTQLKGDIGILRGDGTQTTQRVYWNNKATAIVSDVPSEAMLTPGLWGTLKFEKE